MARSVAAFTRGVYASHFPKPVKELWKGTPSTVPRTFTKPRVPKNSTEPGQTTYAHPPGLPLFSKVAVKRLLSHFSLPAFLKVQGAG